jgi:GNAT superfamily N-acetyltransferase
METNFTFVEITRLDDPILLSWLDLYETSFPPNEKVLVSNHLEVLHARANGGANNDFLLACLDMVGKLRGMARYQLFPDSAFAILWYLATWPDARNQGIGGLFYDHLLSRLDPAACKAMLLEVEIPEQAETQEKRLLAQRRLGFYRRHGAFLLQGIKYMQSVGWHQPLTPMHILVHPLQPIDAAAAYDIVKAYAGDSVQQTGPLELI